MPYSARYLEADQGALPTGKILTAAPGSINDFASAPGLELGHARDQPGFEGNCGADGACEGYNGYFLIEGAPRDAVVVSLASAFSGIRADLRTDQPGVVLYSCNWFDGSAPLKASTQGLPGRDTVTRSSCVAIEAQDYVDGINQYVPPRVCPEACVRACVFANGEPAARNGDASTPRSAARATSTRGRAHGPSATCDWGLWGRSGKPTK